MKGKKLPNKNLIFNGVWGVGAGIRKLWNFFSLPEKNSNLGSAVGSLGIQKSHTRSQIILDRRMRKSNDDK
jgi:hypothetical protein